MPLVGLLFVSLLKTNLFQNGFDFLPVNGSVFCLLMALLFALLFVCFAVVG